MSRQTPFVTSVSLRPQADTQAQALRLRVSSVRLVSFRPFAVWNNPGRSCLPSGGNRESKITTLQKSKPSTSPPSWSISSESDSEFKFESPRVCVRSAALESESACSMVQVASRHGRAAGRWHAGKSTGPLPRRRPSLPVGPSHLKTWRSARWHPGTSRLPGGFRRAAAKPGSRYESEALEISLD